MECNAKMFGTIAYLLVLMGSGGMIVFASKFGFSTNLDGYRMMKARFLRLDGAQVWFASWGFVIVGTLMQLIAFRVTPP
jgi:hypothetical protein